MKYFYSFFLYLVFILKASASHIYEFEYKDKKSFLFGTNHGIPFSELPQPIQDLIKSRQVLIVENTDMLEPLTKSRAEQMSILRDAREDDYISALNEENKIELYRFVQPFLKIKKSEVLIDELNLKGLYATYIAGHSIEGMDYHIVQYFKNKFGNISVMGLENLQQVSTFFEEITLDDLQDTLDCKAGFESAAALQQEIEYLQGLDNIDEADEELVIRNASWLPKILEYHENYPNIGVFCVGYYHLYGEHGLLNLLKKEGCIIKRTNVEGIFNDF